MNTVTNDEDAICDLLDDFARALYGRMPQARLHRLQMMRLLLTSRLRLNKTLT